MPVDIKTPSAFWFLLIGNGIVITLGVWFVGSIYLRSTRIRTFVVISIAVITFLIAYLGWAFYRTSIGYTNAVRLSERQAHTTVGREGYEYIFDPMTHIFIDRIKPNGIAIIFYFVRKHYLPSLSGPECTFPDPEACKWISLNLYLGPDRRAHLWKMVLSSSILGLISAGGFYLLTEQIEAIEVSAS